MSQAQPQPLAAGILRASAPGLSGIIASRLHEEAPDAAANIGSFDSWKRHVEQHLLQLAAALSDGAPQSFVKQILWSRDAFDARGQSVEALDSLLDIAQETLQENVPDGKAALTPYYDAARAALAGVSSPDVSHLDESTPHGALATRYLAALRAGDEPAAIEIVLGAIREETLTTSEITHLVLVPSLREIGREWHLNRLTIAEEHFATAVTQKLLARILGQSPASEPNGKSVLLTAASGDSHGFGIQIIAAEFELDGWRTICLGTDMPPEDLADMAALHGVDLVGIGATLDTQRQSVQASIGALRSARPELKIIVGGQAFLGMDDTWRRCGADEFAPTARAAVEKGRQLVGLTAS